MKMRLSHFSCIEILKFTVAVAIGFTFRILIETSRPNEFHNPQYGGKVDEYGPVHDQLRESYQPLDRDEIIKYQFFRNSYLYDVPREEPKWKMLKHEHKDLADVMRQSVKFIKSKLKINTVESTLLGGMERLDPLRGKEYILDISIKLSSRKTKTYRIHCVRPFNDIQIIKDEDLTAEEETTSVSKALHLVIAAHSTDLNRNLIDNLFKYLTQHLFKLVNQSSLRIYIVVDPHYSNLPTLKSTVKRFNEDFRGASIVTLLYVKEANPYTLIGARQYATDQVPSQAVKLGFLDLSHTVVSNYLGQFIDRCVAALSEELEHAIYSPIPFVLFANSSGSVEGLLSTATSEEDSSIIGGKFGFWDQHDYSTLCVRKDTLKLVSMDFDSTKYSWDAYSEMLQKFTKKRIPVIRSVDPAIYMTYKDYKCNELDKLKVLPLTECQHRT